MTTKQLIAGLKKHEAQLAKERDALRELEMEIEEMRELADDVVESIRYAIERLSERV